MDAPNLPEATPSVVVPVMVSVCQQIDWLEEVLGFICTEAYSE